ncbi:MAG: VWA domain-containing protein [Acidobacteria bacterium]|nr:VWA domain-containing protein [Acidobacteriota bacterium]
MPTVFLAIAFLWVFLGQAFAQQPSASQEPVFPEGEAPPIRVLVEEVNVQFIVTDKKGRLITDLNEEDFRVLEEKQPQEIIAFSRESDVPLRIGLLVDTSNSIRDRFGFEQRAAAEFLRSLLRFGKDQAFLGSFDSMAELVQDFTDDIDKLVGAIESLRPGGGTALYDAIYFGSKNKMMDEAYPASQVRRTMVVLSDGEDNQSRSSRFQALEMAQRAGVILYTISTNIRGIPFPGDKVLKLFAEETGGRFFQPHNMEDLSRAFEEINMELRSQYSISYRSTMPRDGTYHEIEIIPQKKDMRVRARRGYFAAKPPG